MTYKEETKIFWGLTVQKGNSIGSPGHPSTIRCKCLLSKQSILVGGKHVALFLISKTQLTPTHKTHNTNKTHTHNTNKTTHNSDNTQNTHFLVFILTHTHHCPPARACVSLVFISSKWCECWNQDGFWHKEALKLLVLKIYDWSLWFLFFWDKSTGSDKRLQFRSLNITHTQFQGFTKSVWLHNPFFLIIATVKQKLFSIELAKNFQLGE